MRLNRLDLNLFVAFDAIYAQGNLTRAAEVLHLTQPAVSNALARLRGHFDDPLFVRTADGMTPTPVAREASGPIRKALQLLEGSIKPADSFDPASSDMVVNCSLLDLAEALLLPGLLAQLERQAPGVTLRSYYVPRQDVARALASGTLSFAVDVALPAGAELRHQALLPEDYVVAVRRRHPVIRRKPTLRQYLAVGHLHVSSRWHGMGVIDYALKNMGERRRIVARIAHYTAAPRIVARSDLALTLPRDLAEGMGLAVYPLPFETSPAALRLYWHRSADADPATRWLCDAVASQSRSVDSCR